MSQQNVERLFQPQPEQGEALRRPPTPEEVEFFRRAQETEARLDAEARAREAAEAEYRSSVDGQLEPYREGDPPDAKELGVNVTGLLPQRARLIRFAGWLDKARAEVVRLEAAKDRFLTIMGAPDLTRQELEALQTKDRSGFLAWLLGGANGQKPALESFRRAQIEGKLAEQTHEAETARHALETIDAEIAFAKRVVETLEARHWKFMRDVLIEAAGPIEREYEETVQRLESLATELAGLHGRRHEIDLQLPFLGGLQRRFVVPEAAIKEAASAWRAEGERLKADPRAAIRRTRLVS